MLAITLAATLSSLTAAAPAGYALPKSTHTAPGELSTPSLEHHELLRIQRDFGDRDFVVVLDGWVPRGRTGELAGVRIWWLDHGKGDERSPFGKTARKYVDVDYQRRTDVAWSVAIAGDGKRFAFDVELGPDGRPNAYADIRTSDGRDVDHCRATKSKLSARRVLGVPVGFGRLTVTCVDGDGRWHRGDLKSSRG